MSETREVTHAHYGRGGGSIHYGRHSYSTGLTIGEILERCETGVEYPGTTAERKITVRPGTVLIDTSTVPEDRIVDYAYRGPMVDATLPPMTVHGMRPPVPWVDDGEFGNAGGFDNVSADVAVIIAERFGATVTVLA